MLICVKPPLRSRFSTSSAALRDVPAVAPGQRGWDAMAMRPPGVQGAHGGYPGTRDPVLNGGGHRPPHCPWHASLAEQKALMASRAGAPGWRQLAQRKLAELDEQIARAQAAREAIRHGLRCPHEDITRCPNFNAGITARLAQPLSRSHQQLHGQRFHEVPDSF